MVTTTMQQAAPERETTRAVMGHGMRRREVVRATLICAATIAGGAVLAACGTEPVATPTNAGLLGQQAPTPMPSVLPIAVPVSPVPGAATTPTALAAPFGAITPPPTIAVPVTPTTAPATAAATAAPTALPMPAVSAVTTSMTTTMPMSGKLPSPAPGVPDAYTSAPPLFRAVAMIPGRGGKISIVKASQQAPPPPRDQNVWWQELEKRLGTQIDFTLVPLPSYTEKATTLIASGDLPDLLSISPQTTPDQLKAVTQGAFTDLTSLLGGAGLRDYPNLAQYPAAVWKNALIQRKLWGVPRLGFTFGNPLLYRLDWAAKFGLAHPKNADEFLALVTRATRDDPDGNGKPDTFGLGAQGGDWSLGFINGMFRVSNGWRQNADGTLTNAIETPEYGQSLAFARRIFEAGAYHPDAASLNRSQATDALISGKIGGYVDQLFQLNGDIRVRYESKRLTPTADLGALVPPGADGGVGVTYNSAGFGGLVAIPAKTGRDPERAKELLRVLDYFSAAFGSEEYTFLNYGLEGTHHTLRPDGARVLTDRGRTEINELGNVVYPPRVFSYPADPGDAALLQGFARDIAALGIDNPALAAYSPTNAMRGGELTRFTADRVSAFVTGRVPLSDLDSFVRDWRTRGGDQIRTELQADMR